MDEVLVEVYGRIPPMVIAVIFLVNCVMLVWRWRWVREGGVLAGALPRLYVGLLYLWFWGEDMGLVPGFSIAARGALVRGGLLLIGIQELAVHVPRLVIMVRLLWKLY